eukprot:TRINITY_DN2460_c0_g1_i5.p1 TRINITY_DN2460_c0_g1~~TRINITY_DN2460_c0_g1_i5.p1  ORF type:complete len:418 (+),score=102.28 TRINITY_DN2460_c0_g1_i5:342-1595(+)
MGACTLPGNFFIVSEYLPGGDVEHLLHDRTQEISLYRRMQMARDAALGMNWLHCSNPQVCHRDLKTSNLLIDEKGTVKVCDFGLSQMKRHGENLRDGDSAKGTPLWMAPEVMLFKEFNEKSDVYSFGIVLWELLTRQEPFSHHTDYAKFREAVCKYGERPPIPPNTEPVLRNLIERCWHPNPEFRPSFHQIIKELDVVLIHVAISDAYGRLFWQQHFLDKSEKLEEIPWGRFSMELMQFLGLPMVDPVHTKNVHVVNIKCLKALIVDKHKSSQVVTLEDFGKLLKWFGPITPPEAGGFGGAPSMTFLDTIRIMLAKPWFHGKTDKEEAEARLSGKVAGTFLIRFSSIDGFYTVSILTPNRRIMHQRIEHVSGGPYVINGQQYPSLDDLVAGQGFHLPCPGSQYQHLFHETQAGYVFK